MFVIQQLKNQINLKFWVMLVCLVSSAFFFAEILDDVFFDPLESDYEVYAFDQGIGDFIRSFRTPVLTEVMRDMTALGSVSVIATFFLIFLTVLLNFRDYQGIIFMSILLAGGGIIPMTLKLLFGRERPSENEFLVLVHDLSFPSGHAFGSTVAYLGFAYYASRFVQKTHQGLFFYLLAILIIGIICVSRIYLGVHYPTDVLAGFSGGAIWALVAMMIHEKVRENIPRKTL